jgi:glycosyltransferase involved in cell wall biosynthesis
MLNDYYAPGSENGKRLDPNEVVDIYNKSKIGIILSEVEGGCKVSGEYLLCGLPVLSTVCVGGREWWYNENNTVICDGSSDAVLWAYNEIIKKLNEGFYNPEEIREEHIKMQLEFRNTFIDKVGEILDLNNVAIFDHEALFKYRLKVAKEYSSQNEGLIFLQSGKCTHDFTRVVKILRED